MLFDSIPRYFLAKINGDMYSEIRTRFEVKSYPTLIFFKRGSPTEFTGTRSTRGIVDYIRKNGPDTVQKLGCGQL